MSFGTKQRKFFRRESNKRMTGLVIVALMLFSSVSLSWAADSDLQDDIGEVLAQEGLTGAAWMLIGDDADASLAWGHVDDGSRYAASPVFIRPAAQFTTTVGDLSRFAYFLLNEAMVDGRRYIDPNLCILARPRGLQSGDLMRRKAKRMSSGSIINCRGKACIGNPR
jgi:hypothetical protein